MAKVQNCLACGRDTKAESGYCHRCITTHCSWGSTQMPKESKDRPAFTYGGEPLSRLTAIHEDDYSEDAEDGQYRPDAGSVDAQEETRHFKKMKRRIEGR